MRVLSISKNAANQSSLLLSSGRKKRGISLSNEKEGKGMESCPSVMPFMTSRQLKERSNRVEKFIIYDMNREQWELHKIKTTTRETPKMNFVHSLQNSKPVVVQKEKEMDKENEWKIQIDNVEINRTRNGRARDRNRTNQIQKRINEIETRLNSLIRNHTYR